MNSLAFRNNVQENEGLSSSARQRKVPRSHEASDAASVAITRQKKNAIAAINMHLFQLEYLWCLNETAQEASLDSLRELENALMQKVIEQHILCSGPPTGPRPW